MQCPDTQTRKWSESKANSNHMLGVSFFMKIVNSDQCHSMAIWHQGPASCKSQWVSEWFSLTTFLRTADIEVHIVHTSRIIIAYTLKSLSRANEMSYCKSLTHKFGSLNHCIALKFDKCLNSCAVDTCVKFYSSHTILNAYFATTRDLTKRGVM